MRFHVDRSIPLARNNWLRKAKNIYYTSGKFSIASANIQQVPSITSYRRHDLHDIDTIASKDNSIIFRSFKYLPRKIRIGYRVIGFASPQGINVTSNGGFAYISYNSSSSNDNKFGRNQVELIRVSLKNPGKIVSKGSDDIAVGNPFAGGHGQSITRNPKDGSIWNMASDEGNTNHGYMQRIDRSKLLPFYQIPFNIKKHHHLFGDDIVFDGHNHIYNFERPAGSDYLNICRGTLNYKAGFHMDLLSQRIPSPSYIIQDTSYNPSNGRIYIASDNQITSFPANRIGKLRSRDFRQCTFDSDRETEGLSFDDNGTAYLLMSRSPEILVSNSFN